MSPDEALLHAIRVQASPEYDRLGHVQAALDQGADPSAQSPDRVSALHWACWAKLPAIVKLLLERNADIHYRTPEKAQTCLHWACLAGEVCSIKMLLDAGANMRDTDYLGFSALHFAAQNGHLAAIDYLFLSGADLEARGYQGRTALHCAMELNQEKAMLILLHLGADVHATDDAGRLPLHLAVEKANWHLLNRAFQNYYYSFFPQLSIPNQNGETPVELAIRLADANEHVPLLSVPSKRTKDLFQKLLKRQNQVWRQIAYSREGVPRLGLFVSTWTVVWIVMWQLQHIYVVMPLSSYGTTYHATVWFCTLTALVSWIICRFEDPGFVPLRPLPSFSIDKGEGQRSRVKDSNHDLTSGDPRNIYEWSEAYEQCLASGEIGMICVLCRAVKPPRTRHCHNCRRCVTRFDHHCPFIDNCVGSKNYRVFLIFVYATTLDGLLYIWSNYDVFATGRLPLRAGIWSLLFTIHAIFMEFFVIGLSIFHTRFVLRNKTTSEFARPHQHSYLTWDSSRMDFQNPFDKGPVQNVLGVCLADNSQSENLARKQVALSQSKLHPVLKAPAINASTNSNNGSNHLIRSRDDWLL